MKYFLATVLILFNWIPTKAFNSNPEDSICLSFIIDSVNTKNNTCNGYNDGQIEINASGGTAPYHYYWNTGDTSSTLYNLYEGHYFVKILDSMQCEIIDSFSISEPDSINLHVIASAESSYNQQDGKAVAFVYNGQAPYTYFWSNGDTTQITDSLSSGNYNLMVTDTLGCYSTAVIEIDTSLTSGNFDFINFPQNLQLYSRDLISDSAVVKISGTENSGIFSSIDLVIYRDQKPFSFITKELIYDNWGSATFEIDYSIFAELKNYTFEFYVTSNTGFGSLIKNANDVVAGDVILINGQSNAESKMEGTSANGVSNNFIRVFSSGTNSYSQLLNNLDWHIGNVDGGRNTNGNTGQFGAKIAYEIIKNKEIPVAIFNGAFPNVPIPYFTKNLFQPNDLSTNYGRLLYRLENTELKNAVRTIIWYQGENDSKSSITSQDYYNTLFYLVNDWFNDYINLEQVYIHQIRESCGFNPVDILEIQEAQRILSKKMNKVEIMTSIGVPLYEDDCHYDFSGGSEMVGSRIYQLLDKDLYGNSNLQNVEAPLPQTIIRSGEKELTLMLANENDKYSIEAGIENYFTFSDSTNYVIDAILSNENTAILNMAKPVDNLTHVSLYGIAGNEAVSPSIKNASGIGIVSFMNFPIADCTNFSIEIIGGNISCNSMADGTASILVQGGQPPYNFEWSNGAITNTISNLNSGVYSCTIEDDYGCKIDRTIEVSEPETLTVTASIDSLSYFASNTGSISLSVNGGNAPYTYNWSNGSTTFQINNLGFGTYNCNVTDVNGCNELYLVTINDSLCTPINVIVFSGDMACFQLNSGSFVVDSIAGGVQPYSISWSNGSNEELIDSLTVGTYVLEVSDSSGCYFSDYYTIYGHEEIEITQSIINVSNVNAADGEIDLLVSGGVPPYRYNWSNGDTTNCINNLAAGYYFVIVEDIMGCSLTLDSIEVNVATCPIFYYDLNQSYTPDTINAMRSILSNTYINSIDTIIFTAGERITLETGFKIEAGTNFKAYNEYCQ